MERNSASNSYSILFWLLILVPDDLANPFIFGNNEFRIKKHVMGRPTRKPASEFPFNSLPLDVYVRSMQAQ